MQTGNQDEEVRKFCYEEQTKLAVNMVRPGFVILDVGCGPELAYRKPSSTTVIGVDPSLPSLRANAELDLGIWGTAACLPIRSATIDVVFCFYSVHHMVGNTQAENRRIVSATFTELGRVVKGGGHIVVFDMSPWYLAWLFQRLSWNHVKRALGQKLDMYFWRENPLISHVGRHLPGSTVRTVTFASNPFSRFPPVFSAPWFRVPRFLYPMDPKTYIWTLS
jgi:SAM-dependent methyltransferase